MWTYVIGLEEVDRTKTDAVGGKGANLGELSKLDGIRVPAGFCVTTDAFRQSTRDAIGALLDRLSALDRADGDSIRELGAELRAVVERTEIPPDVLEAVTDALSELGPHDAYAVRSSATAEDLPGASFAGQQDTFLNVTGAESIAQHVRRCWASLFSERAVAYRIQHGFDHRKVQMAVVVQKMVFAEVSGVLFTADPLTSNRKIASIETVVGLGEGLVGGMVNAHRYRVRDGRIIERAISGGSAVTDAQILRLDRLGRQIERHFGAPQDIEWCMRDDELFIVQSRPITTLYPIPGASDPGNHVYISVGHQQMMTDAMKPLGLSFFQLTTGRNMLAAGGRLFVDLTKELASPTTRNVFLGVLGRSDPLMKDALETVLERGFVEPLPPEPPRPGAPPSIFDARVDNDPAIVDELIARSEAAIDALKKAIATKSGPALFDFIRDDVEQLRKALGDPRSMGSIMASMNAAAWINEKMLTWLGEKSVADRLAQSVPHNVTGEMGLELLDVADVIRPHPEVIAYLQRVARDDYLDELTGIEGGQQARDAIRAYLDKYGMRCAGEIDITRPRWSEKPTTLIPSILNNIENFEPGEAERKFEQGRREATELARSLLERLRQLPDGEKKADEAAEMIDRLRNFSGYREYPKYHIVNRYVVYKRALLQEAERLVQAGAIRDVDDISYLTFDELRDVAATQEVARALIDERRADQQRFEKLKPPRVITSEGEIVTGAYKRADLPVDAIVGLAVSSGVVEGRARVVLDMAQADLGPGDILVTTFTDPSWTPLFVSITGLVTEVGGLMTHGAVIAREYGLPAVVGVENATSLIRDGQHIRVNGTDGYVEILR
jgi:rifampicin phosphotransferase